MFQESGFEVVLDDTVLRSCLTKPDSPQFEPKLFKVGGGYVVEGLFYQTMRLS